MVNDALGELFPVIDVENGPGENLALLGTQLGWCSTFLPAGGAGNFNHHQLFNPADSQTLLVCTRVDLFSTTAQTIRFSLAIAAQATLAGNERRRDTRAGVNANLVAQNRTGVSVVSGGLDYRIRVQAQINADLHDDNGIAVIFPGTGLTVTTETANTASQVAFMWRERVFEVSEEVSA